MLDSKLCVWSEGNSGGILYLWNKSYSKLIFSFSGDGFVGVCLEWGPLATRCFVVNIYSKCDLVAKRRLWDNLVEVKEGLGDGVWCMVGDFNAVRCRDERRGGARGGY